LHTVTNSTIITLPSMRKIILSISLFLLVFVASAHQFTTTGTCKIDREITGDKDTVYVFVFNGINPSTEITYNGTENVNWYKFSDTTNSISNVSYLSPENATGYILDVEGKRPIIIWVIDYTKYLLPASVDAENNPGSQCEVVKLNIVVPDLSFQTLNGDIHILPRFFKVSYQTLEWADSWKKIEKSEEITLPANEVTVPAPLCDTYFTLLGDQYSTSLGVPVNVKSFNYKAVAVKCHPTFIIQKREEKNEAEKPFQNTQTKFSAPLDCEFLSNANEPVALYYKWEIFKDKQLIISRTDKDHRYTFTEAGVYKVKVVTSNEYCSNSDSLNITISESAIHVPNVFTPNGDEFNNEFRVAYKSIVSFQCWVYNRWGRKVFYWTDPQKGWDGTINGKKAAAGPYFYIINAVGSDGIKYKLKGDINLLRGKGNN